MESRRNGPQLSSRHDDDDDDISSVGNLQLLAPTFLARDAAAYDQVLSSAFLAL